MYLKSIKASGFKSFADKIDIELNDGITAIVGPNGSGKSNIVDAIRWVLGEQSVKSLRGADVMSDVIFSGSASRDPHKRASVSLVFDNKEHYLNTEFDEVEIKRTVYTTGENEYYINNTKVRLKDITNLFIDTGAGVGAFNIISQGNITDIVNSKPLDRRIIFESAAGVLKYKKRKEEALRKLDKTKDNLNSIKLVIDELAQTVEPLKEQSELAKKYLDIQDRLKGIEIALIHSDITMYNERFSTVNDSISKLQMELEDYSGFLNDAELEKLKLDSTKLDEEISNINQNLININDELSKLSSLKQVTLERQRYKVSKSDLDEAQIKAKEEVLELEKNIHLLDNEIKNINKEKTDKEKLAKQFEDDLLNIKIKKSSIDANVDETNKRLFYLQNKIDIAKESVLNEDRLPQAVRHILNNKRLGGVHSTIGNLIQIDYQYELAINVALGASTNFVVVDSFDDAKNCIGYLKRENLGRATFFPISNIKSRYIEKSVLNDICENDCVLGIASDLVDYDKKYKNIIENQLGNVIVVKTVDDLDVIGKKVNYRYRCVSLDGDILHAGGSVSGGAKSTVHKTSKQILNSLESEYNVLKSELDSIIIKQRKINEKYNELLEKEESLNKEIILLKENLKNKDLSYKVLEESLAEKNSMISGSESISKNKLDDELVKILEDYTLKSEEKTLLESRLDECKNKRTDINLKINDLEKDLRDKNTQYNKLQNELKNFEVEKGKIDVKLDNLLLHLSEDYNLTYEAARDKYDLDLDMDEARSKVKSLKRELDSLGEVNTGAIGEYERLSKRYQFLLDQRGDLEKASEDLIGVIDEMDDIMVTKFKTSFDAIAAEFKSVFRTIFQGGKGELKLTDPDNILQSGIQIVAEPPGKKINSTVALSGGEQSLTAICLLFSILNVRPVPFIILDEAEAALDEANVDMFGKYICEKKKDSQFILITHKKRMMEYADTLYGITMQESGVSKIVSARLEE